MPSPGSRGGGSRNAGSQLGTAAGAGETLGEGQVPASEVREGHRAQPEQAPGVQELSGQMLHTALPAAAQQWPGEARTPPTQAFQGPCLTGWCLGIQQAQALPTGASPALGCHWVSRRSGPERHCTWVDRGCSRWSSSTSLSKAVAWWSSLLSALP